VPVFRRAGAADLVALLDLERAASQAGLGHVFAPDDHPFPDDDVLARWALLLEEPGARVDVVDDPATSSGLALLTAYDATSLRHLAVDPSRWGTGLGRAGVERATAAVAAGGGTVAGLWCLERNHRAHALYERLAWRPTGERRDAVWPPHPVEMAYEVDVTS